MEGTENKPTFSYVSMNDVKLHFGRNYNVTVLPIEIFQSLIATPECGNVLTPYYPISTLYSPICQVVDYGRLKTKGYKSCCGPLQEVPHKEM